MTQEAQPATPAVPWVSAPEGKRFNINKIMLPPGYMIDGDALAKDGTLQFIAAPPAVPAEPVAWQMGEEEAGYNAAKYRLASPAASPSVLRQAMEALWVCAEHNALHFGENHNTVIQSRAALSAIREELAAIPQQPMATAQAIAAEQAEDAGLWFVAQTAPEAMLQAALRRLAAAVEADCAPLAARRLAKHQPCGCVICTCDDEEQCRGCGARHCGAHPIGELPHPLHEPVAEHLAARPVVPRAEAIRQGTNHFYISRHLGEDGALRRALDLVWGYARFGQGSSAVEPREGGSVVGSIPTSDHQDAVRPVVALSLSDEQIRKLAERYGSFGESDHGDGSESFTADGERVVDFARAVLAAPAPAANAIGKPDLDPITVEACAKECERASSGYWSQLFASRIRALASAPAVPQAAVDVMAERELGFIKPDTDKQVFFYEQDFYVLSNFSAFDLRWNGLRFLTSEAAYHFEKFPSNVQIQTAIINAPSAHEAFKLAERYKGARRKDWDDVKVGTMLDILRAKAAQHEYVRRKLLATGDRELIEDSWRDDFWGWGPNRDGQNMMGKLWMQVRSELRAEIERLDRAAAKGQP